MTAGLLAYKLCDRALDCEGCPLDAALRGRAGATTATERHASRPHRGGALTFPGDRRYARNHLWIQAVEEGVVRVGLDALVARLADAPVALDLPREGELVTRGGPLVTLSGDAGDLRLSSPVTGRVVAVNEPLRHAPDAALEAPYGDGWLVEVAMTATADFGHLASAADMRRQAHHDAQRLRRKVAMELLTSHQDVGPTMADGGEILVDLQALVGPTRHLELLHELLEE
jgi:glycine cleavage system H protein